MMLGRTKQQYLAEQYNNTKQNILITNTLLAKEHNTTRQNGITKQRNKTMQQKGAKDTILQCRITRNITRQKDRTLQGRMPQHYKAEGGNTTRQKNTTRPGRIYLSLKHYPQQNNAKDKTL